ncbi:hypothetical protein A9Q99_08220 [Gammaproteobacteria bacterium 45_16_T64]|nr:hypothetical protein A9Q99_08220 [Gammaproteobacteria bacterium 45_16_T64]
MDGAGIILSTSYGEKGASKPKADRQGWLRAFEEEAFDDFGEKAATKTLEGKPSEDFVPLKEHDQNVDKRVTSNVVVEKNSHVVEMENTLNTSVVFSQLAPVSTEISSITSKVLDVAYTQSTYRSDASQLNRHNSSQIKHASEALAKENSEFKEINILVSQHGDKTTLLLRNFFVDNEKDKIHWAMRLQKLLESTGMVIDEIKVNGQLVELPESK